MSKKAAFGSIVSVQYLQTGSYINIAAVGDITGPEVSVEPIDVTTHDSADAFDESLPGLASGGEVSWDVVFLTDETQHETLFAAVAARGIHNFYLKLPGFVSTGDGGYFSFAGFFTKFGVTFPVKDKIGGSVTVKVTGKPVYHPFVS